MNPEKLKQDFPIFRNRPELVYLDNAATSQKPEAVIDRMESFYERQNANVGRGLYDLAGEATEEYREARQKVGSFVNARADETVFVRNTTEAMNLLAASLELDGGIVCSEMAHHSEQLPWRRKAEQENLDFTYIPTENYRIDLEAAEEIIDEDTSLVSVSHISNVFGTENPVRELAELAHENDAYIVVDAAQSVPHRSVDVKELDADFVAFSGHKMLGPQGTGVLYGRKRLLEEMPPYQVGGGMIRKVEKDDVEYESGPERFEAGTPNVAGAVGLAAAVDYLEEVGMNKIRSHERKLVKEIIPGLEGIEGVEVLAPEDREVSLVSFTADFAHPHDIAEILNSEDVAVRAGHHCAQPQMEELDVSGTTRVSPYLYNTDGDIKKLVEAVRKVRKVFS